jgi:hypothetical protein
MPAGQIRRLYPLARSGDRACQMVDAANPVSLFATVGQLLMSVAAE